MDLSNASEFLDPGPPNSAGALRAYLECIRNEFNVCINEGDDSGVAKNRVIRKLMLGFKDETDYATKKLGNNKVSAKILANSRLNHSYLVNIEEGDNNFKSSKSMDIPPHINYCECHDFQKYVIEMGSKILLLRAAKKESKKNKEKMSGIKRVLFVAEKNDAAKNISSILSRNNAQRRDSFSIYNKIYEFPGTVFNQRANIKATSVSGHLMELEYPSQYRQWEAAKIDELFTANLNRTVTDSMKNIQKSLQKLASENDVLVIWTDCDREGEHIGAEIVHTCLSVNPRMDVWRARFSEITPRAINAALENLVRLDERQVDAVDCRIELDLRIGASFTRLQTLYLQQRFANVLSSLTGDAKSVISYGSCQFPTLGFVVERYLAVKDFNPEQFWKLVAKHTKEGITTDFAWERVRLFCQDSVQTYFNFCQAHLQDAQVVEVNKHPKSKWRPVAMDTICLEKLAVRMLKMTAKEAMTNAEKLYSQGYISYPRTETNIFPAGMGLNNLIEQQSMSSEWGEFASNVMGSGGPKPRNGNKSDQAHPPIHPLKFATKDQLQGNMWRIYELVVRHFLACCSRDAKGQETTIRLKVWDEIFCVNGLLIEDEGYLKVYPYDKWVDKKLPNYVVGEKLAPNLKVEKQDGLTAAPLLLNEADLITLMDKYGIGTDATHAEHIEKIQIRKYAALNHERRFMPSFLGIGLVMGYNTMGYELSKPELRADLEDKLKLICEGTANKQDVLDNQLIKYKRIFDATEAAISTLGDAFQSQLNTRSQPQGPVVPNNNGNQRPTYQAPVPEPASYENQPSQRGGRGRGRGGTRGNRGASRGASRGGGNRSNSRSTNSANAPPTPGNDGGVQCNCSMPAKPLVVKKDGPNKGKPFFACAKNYGDSSKCNFFQWG
uniref:DNA topoisomerase n=1 Tax=Rhabditophanes sp. KR3021 TaxID=114890 RepID=A0AC35TVD5_9BILA